MRKLKANEVSIDQLKASLSRSSSTDDFSEELELQPRKIVDSATGIPNFDEIFRQWYQLQFKANRWTHRSSIAKPIRGYEMHLEAALGNLCINKITRIDLKNLLQSLYLSNRDLGPALHGYRKKSMTYFTFSNNGVQLLANRNKAYDMQTLVGFTLG